MARNYYKKIPKEKKSASDITAIVFVSITVLLVVFIVWSVIVFNNNRDGAFENQTDEISELKILTNQQMAEIDALNKKLDDMSAQLESKNGEISDKNKQIDKLTEKLKKYESSDGEDE